MHLVGARTIPAHVPAIILTLHQFLEKKFLFWLEVLSVLGAAGNVVEVLQDVVDWLEVCRASILDLLLVFTQTGSRSRQHLTLPMTVFVS
jgi:hypothetical protein